MPFELSVAPNDPVARVRGWGDETFESTLASIHRISTDPRLAREAPVLMDVRDLEYLATPPEVTSFASPSAMPPLFADRRVAILTRRGTQQAIARAFASKAAQARPGAQIEVFVEPRLADTWLREIR